MQLVVQKTVQLVLCHFVIFRIGLDTDEINGNGQNHWTLCMHGRVDPMHVLISDLSSAVVFIKSIYTGGQDISI